MSGHMIQIVRGNAARTVRVVGSIALVGSALLALPLWLIVKDTAETKIAVEVAYVIVGIVLITAASIAAACTVAKVQDGRLDFFFCGMRMRSFALDGDTTFDLLKIGRVNMLRIRRGTKSYVPNGALDKGGLVDLLRTNGVAERKADWANAVMNRIRTERDKRGGSEAHQ
jgi:intracellular sulfur oxidation DsrE/DsrF family protein